MLAQQKVLVQPYISELEKHAYDHCFMSAHVLKQQLDGDDMKRIYDRRGS